jgi:hypothetical protein
VTTPTTQQVHALKLVLEAVISAVSAAEPHGAPGGVIFAAMHAQGCSLGQYESIMSGLVSIGKLRRSGDLYHLTSSGAAS